MLYVVHFVSGNTILHSTYIHAINEQDALNHAIQMDIMVPGYVMGDTIHLYAVPCYDPEEEYNIIANMVNGVPTV